MVPYSETVLFEVEENGQIVGQTYFDYFTRENIESGVVYRYRVREIVKNNIGKWSEYFYLSLDEQLDSAVVQGATEIVFVAPQTEDKGKSIASSLFLLSLIFLMILIVRKKQKG